MFDVRTTVDIAVPREQVWDALTDVEGYRRWNSVLHHIGGRPSLGGEIRLRLTPPRGRSYSFSPTVTDLIPNQRFAWLGTTVTTGVFDGAHFFELTPTEDGTHLVNGERFSGVLSPVFKRLLVNADDVAHGFDVMNQELRRHLENTDSADR